MPLELSPKFLSIIEVGVQVTMLHMLHGGAEPKICDISDVLL